MSEEMRKRFDRYIAHKDFYAAYAIAMCADDKEMLGKLVKPISEKLDSLNKEAADNKIQDEVLGRLLKAVVSRIDSGLFQES